MAKMPIYSLMTLVKTVHFFSLSHLNGQEMEIDLLLILLQKWPQLVCMWQEVQA